MTLSASQIADPVASSEDEPIDWYDASKCARVHAKRSSAALHGDRKWWRHSAKAEYMRAATDADCPIHGAELPAGVARLEIEDDERCRCWYAEEGWHWVCAASAPGAFRVWRVEPRAFVPEWWQRRYHRWMRRFVWRSPRPVLWGGRPECRATWFAMKVLRYPGLIRLGDYQAIRRDSPR